MNDGLRIAFLEIQDVIDLRSAPGVDGLGVVPHGHEAVGLAGEEIDQRALDGVRILILIDEDVAETLLVDLENFRMRSEKIHCEAEHVVEI